MNKSLVNDMYAPGGDQPLEFGRIYPPRRAWLARHVEEVLEPDLPIIDAHCHLLSVPGNSYLGSDLAADLSTGHRIAGSVYVEAQTCYWASGPESLRPVGETEFAATSAQFDGRVATGIVGFADLMLGESVRDVLESHIAAGQGRFKGVRYSTALDPNPAIRVHRIPPDGVLTHPAFGAGLKVLTEMGLSFDAWAFFHQQEQIAQMAATHPELSIVVGHCGGLLGYGPYAKLGRGVFKQWRQNMALLASCTNVHVKLGGILHRLAAYDYLNSDKPETSEALAACLRPYILTCIDLFGAQRCMFESNYPVDSVVTSYVVLWNVFKRITADLSTSEKLALYGDTARKIYRLDC